MSDRALKVAVVGAGKMGREHATAIQAGRGMAELIAVIDPSREARDALAADFPDAEPFESLEAALERVSPDVVHVCTPGPTHESLAEAALSAGCHVYVEKPFALDVRGAERLLSLARARGVTVTAGHQLLFQRPTLRAAGYAEATRPIVHLESYFSFRPGRQADRRPLDETEQLIDILPHPVYVLDHFLALAAPGEPFSPPHIELGPGPTLHAILRRGEVRGALTVTLSGRPVESFLRVVGANGSVTIDYVRDIVTRLLGPGSSGPDKLAAPFLVSAQTVLGTLGSLWQRLRRRERSYPGLRDAIEAFHEAVAAGEPAPVGPENILATTAVVEAVSTALEAADRDEPDGAPAELTEAGAPSVFVTGGTGLLGRSLTRALRERGARVTVAARRLPPRREREAGVRYEAVDLGDPLPAGLLSGHDVAVHCAAATAGGFEAHQRASIDATRNLLTACREDGVGRVVLVSSLAVVRPAGRGRPIAEDSPAEPDPRAAGPYVWGKLEAERVARELAPELGIDLKVARPGPIVDPRQFAPPGRSGKRIAHLFVAFGNPGERLAIVSLPTAAAMLAWIAQHFDRVPDTIHLLDPEAPTRRELVDRLKARNPGIRAIWVPRPLVPPLSLAAVAAQKLLRPRRRALSLRKIFADRPVDTSASRELWGRIEGEEAALAPRASRPPAAVGTPIAP